MFSSKLVKMNYLRRNTVSVITSTFKREILTQYKYKNCLSTSATSLYNAENGVNDDYDWMKGRKKSQAPSTVYRDPVRQVYISQSNDVFTNLALEDWLYKNFDFDHKSLLLIWQNNPCVVIGRHQNPWTEANVPFVRGSSTNLARRNSGGGTVYHDMGNLNCTFFTRKSGYDRRRNLDIVCKAIQSVSSVLQVRVNDRDDIVVNDGFDPKEDKKISGTAAKLGPKTAYHHCTVLVDVNECVLHDALNSKAVGVESRATQSVRVPVKNLQRYDPSINVNQLQESLGYQFLRTNVDGEDGGMEALQHTRGFQMIRPDDEWFPGLQKTREEFESFKWIYGKTPKFKVTQAFSVPKSLLKKGLHTNQYLNPNISKGEESIENFDSTAKIQIELEVNSGIVELVKIQQQPYVGFLRPEVDSSLASAIQGERFGPHLPDTVRNRIKDTGIFEDCDEATQDFLADCVQTMVGKFA